MSFTKYGGFSKKNLEKEIIADLHKFNWEQIKKELEQEEADAREHYRKRANNTKVRAWEPDARLERQLSFDLETLGNTSSETGAWFTYTVTTTTASSTPSQRPEVRAEDVEDVQFED